MKMRGWLPFTVLNIMIRHMGENNEKSPYIAMKPNLTINFIYNKPQPHCLPCCFFGAKNNAVPTQASERTPLVAQQPSGING